MQNNAWQWPKSEYTLTNTSTENTAQVPTTKQTIITLKDPSWIIAVFIGLLLFIPLIYAAFYL
jgi:hypothetical protein